jgi:hypothetical protein
MGLADVTLVARYVKVRASLVGKRRLTFLYHCIAMKSEQLLLSRAIGTSRIEVKIRFLK